LSAANSLGWSVVGAARVVPGSSPRRQRALDRRCVALIGGMQCRRDDDTGVEIDGVLGLVGQMCTAVLQLRDLGLWIGLARPLLV
jgi:hypothetical protein